MEEGCEFLCIGLGVCTVCDMGWLFWHGDAPQLVVCTASLDEWFLGVCDGDIIGFGDTGGDSIGFLDTLGLGDNIGFGESG